MNVEALKIERTAARRPSRRPRSRWPARALIAAAAGGAVWLFWAPLQRALDRVRLPEVRVMRVVESHPAAVGAASGTAANGYIVAARRAALSADTPGRIVELNVTEGSVVKKGDIVARLYYEEYAAALRRAEADLEAARARANSAEVGIATARAELEQSRKTLAANGELVAEAEANHELARLELQRAQDLLTRGISSQADFDVAKSAFDASAAQMRAARARLQATEAAAAWSSSRVGEAEANQRVAAADVHAHEAARDLAAATLDKTEVRAPFDGIVVLKDAEVGEVVSPNSQSGSNARGSVCTMVDLHSLEAQAEVPETVVANVMVGARARVFPDAYPSVAYTGRVDRIWPTANRQQGTIEVRIALEKPDAQLRPEMSVRIVFDPADAAEVVPPQDALAILVPQEAVVELEGHAGVFLLSRDVVEFRPVELGDRRAGRVAVRSGLSPGQQIVINPPLDLQSGDRVRIQEG